MNKPQDIVAREGAKLDYSNDMTYGDYLQLDQLLSAQQPLSPVHDEMLFIVQHQTSELWMKLMLHELHAAMQALQTGEASVAFKMMARVSRIMAQLVGAWDVLATMTPPEYSALRPYLANSSGFQSAQYRCIEFALGNKNATMLKPHAHKPELLAMVQQALKHRRCTTLPLVCSPRQACRLTSSTCNATGPKATRAVPTCKRLGRWFTKTHNSIGSCTNWAKSSPILKTRLGCGGSDT